MPINLQVLRRGRLTRLRRLRVNALEERCIFEEFRSFERGFGFGVWVSRRARNVN